MEWWEDAYKGRDDIVVEYSLPHRTGLIVPGTKIKFTNDKGVYIFRCQAANSIGSTWIDCLDAKRGSHRSFHVDRLKGIIKPRRKLKSKN